MGAKREPWNSANPSSPNFPIAGERKKAESLKSEILATSLQLTTENHIPIKPMRGYWSTTKIYNH